MLFHLNRVSGWKNIIFITQKRNKATNDFEKKFYKLLSNAFYVKTMEKI